MFEQAGENLQAARTELSGCGCSLDGGMMVVQRTLCNTGNAVYVSLFTSRQPAEICLGRNDFTHKHMYIVAVTNDVSEIKNGFILCD